MQPTESAALPLLVEPAAPLDVFFRLRGRVSRRTYWLYGVLALLALGTVGYALLTIAGVRNKMAMDVVNVLLLWPAIAVSAKRWHDRNRSAWWVAVALVPVIGWLWAFIDNGFVRGTQGPNRFGPDPLAPTAQAAGALPPPAPGP